MNSSELRRRRDRALAPGYSLFYDEPVQLVRGEGVHLWDDQGRKYLDCYNNVPSVGHCHPRVVEAITKQAATLNTHTRYLHDNVIHLGERLGEKLSEGLANSWFVCSGTEANDLAVQVARTTTGHQGVIVTEASYHGNSTLVHELSTADSDPTTRPDWLGVVEPPNTYRGPFRSTDPDPGHRYGELVQKEVERLNDAGHGVAAILVDTSWDSNGTLIAPDDYLAEATSYVRQSGGLFIADEVQAGYCRLGTNWWGYEKYGVTPDIVTIGKPMGAGHPVAACVTTASIAAAFSKRRSYFNTFGGNPVSAAAALAVIDVIDDEGLLANATSTGSYLGGRLAELAQRHDVIGNVQGSGLFWGLDLVADPDARTPLAVDKMRTVVTRLCERGILMGFTGRYDNVLKIRPPLPFGIADVDQAVDVLDVVLSKRI